MRLFKELQDIYLCQLSIATNTTVNLEYRAHVCLVASLFGMKQFEMFVVVDLTKISCQKCSNKKPNWIRSILCIKSIKTTEFLTLEI